MAAAERGLDLGGGLILEAGFLHIAYMITMIALVLIVHVIARFDLRGFVRRNAGENVAPLIDLLARPDLIGIFSLLTLVAVVAAGYIGFHIPSEVERLYGAGAKGSFVFFGPTVEIPTLGRAAQVVGAACFALIALRLMRIFMVLAALGLLIGLSFLAAGYVFG